MKKTYIQPTTECLEMAVEAIISVSLSKSEDKAGDKFQELGNKKDFGKNPIWE